MIGYLPTALTINGIDRAIRSDFRVALAIFVAFADTELSDNEKMQVLLSLLYEDIETLSPENVQESIEKAILFLDGKAEKSEEKLESTIAKKVMDWEQDEQIIFSAVNKVAGCEVRSLEYLHWWTFLGYFNEVGEGLFSTVVNIRQKKASNKKLEKGEQEYYKNHKDIIDIKQKYTAEEQAEIDYWNNLLK